MKRSEFADLIGWVCFVGAIVSAPSLRSLGLSCFMAMWWIGSAIAKRDERR